MSEAFSVSLGMDAVLVIDGIVCKDVKDVTLSMSKATADVTTRRNSGWRATVGTLKEGTLSTTLVVTSDSASTVQKVINAYLATGSAAMIKIAALDKATDGQGPVAEWSITSLNRGEPLEDAVTYEVEFSIAKFYKWYPDGELSDSDDAAAYATAIGSYGS